MAMDRVAIHRLLYLSAGLCAMLMLISASTAVGEPGRMPQKSPSASETSEKSEEGKKQLAELEKKAQQNSCWKQAVASLRESCSELDDRSQGALALALTNCHLQQYGRATYPCPTPESELSECVRGMDGEAFNALSTFTAHTSSICFFLAAQLWQERTERTVHTLASTASQVAGQLNESLRQNEDLLLMQERSLGNQHVMLDSGNKLQESLAQARRDAEEARKEANAQADVWRENFGDLFRVLAQSERWQAAIGVDWMMAKSLVVYVLLAVVSFYTTAAPQTSAARIWLIGICVLGFLSEYLGIRLAVWWTQGPVELHELNSWIRRIAVLAGVVAFAYTVLRYRDPVTLNTERLDRIEQRIDNVQSLLRKGVEHPGESHLTAAHSVSMNSSQLSSWQPPSAPRNPTPASVQGFGPGPSPNQQAAGTSPQLEPYPPALAASPLYSPVTRSFTGGGHDAVDSGIPTSRAEDSGVGGEESFSLGPAPGEVAAMRSGNPDESASSRRGSHAAKRMPSLTVKRTPRKRDARGTPSQTYNLRSSTPKTS